MGYTHYWTMTRDFTEAEWQKLMLHAAPIMQNQIDDGTPLAYEYDEPSRKPLVSADEIRFNGVGDDGHETLLITRVRHFPEYRPDEHFEFCKTARKPYDTAVVAILCAAAHICDGFSWSSDGDGEPGVFDDGRGLFDAVHQRVEYDDDPGWAIDAAEYICDDR